MDVKIPVGASAVVGDFLNVVLEMLIQHETKLAIGWLQHVSSSRLATAQVTCTKGAITSEIQAFHKAHMTKRNSGLDVLHDLQDLVLTPPVRKPTGMPTGRPGRWGPAVESSRYSTTPGSCGIPYPGSNVSTCPPSRHKSQPATLDSLQCATIDTLPMAAGTFSAEDALPLQLSAPNTLDTLPLMIDHATADLTLQLSAPNTLDEFPVMIGQAAADLWTSGLEAHRNETLLELPELDLSGSDDELPPIDAPRHSRVEGHLSHGEHGCDGVEHDGGFANRVPRGV